MPLDDEQLITLVVGKTVNVTNSVTLITPSVMDA
jgi:hypothetical protein